MKRKLLALALAVLMLVSLVPTGAVASTNGHTAQEAIAYVKSQLGKALDYDGWYGAQCVDLIKYYYDYLGCASYAIGDACDYAGNALPPGWTRLQGAQPQLGDILVYSGTSSNPAGHVAIYESDYSTYHQNLDGKQYVVHATYYFQGLSNPYWGVIRPDFAASSTPMSTSWSGPTATSITETNAYLSGTINYERAASTTQLGVRLMDTQGNVIGGKDEYVSYGTSYVNMWYDINSELGVTLTSGKTYCFYFYTIADGKQYNSDTIKFTTAHTHSYTGKTVTSATCTEAGYTTHTCSCGDSYKDSYTDALGHSYANGSCTRCGAKDPNYTAPAQGGQIIVSQATATAGGSATITVSLKNNPGIAAMALKFSYDTSKLEFVGGEDGGLTGWEIQPTGAVWVDSANSSFDGVVLKLKFKVKDGVPAGEIPVTVSYDNGGIGNIDEEAVTMTVTAGKIVVSDGLPGDINGDGAVNVLDLIRLKKYFAGADVELVGSADLNGDGAVNVLDLIRLKKFLAGADVVLN